MTTDILITGAAGFIGKAVLTELSSKVEINVDGAPRTIGNILALDLSTDALLDLADHDPRIQPISGSLSDKAVLHQIAAVQPGVIVHLAAVVSSAAEADFKLGIDVNVNATIGLIDLIRQFSVAPVFVFSSSVAVFSCADNDTIDEDTLPRPMSSYGTQKLIGELLVRDASRKGIIRGRTLRFPTISVRPGKPNAAASSFASGIIREPLAGQNTVLPVGKDLRLHLASPDRACSNTLAAIALPQDALHGETTITLPGVSVTVAEMLDALGKIGGDAVVARVIEKYDARVAQIVRSWPGKILTPRAEQMGFEADDSIEQIIEQHASLTPERSKS
ncbi:NAD-dependent epimerase/dehydratase family protein [Yoonia sp. F2084L]|uniref:D-erythronate dehydrogenase n=1 Tax=Yoonia sp. F2084L TaxID=2926419 RepID=UPI001FF3DA2A|nr:D-erythronate dehydrogenase [Yoonia sp. F2084L]MCK0096717.1 NAD-dependent epimerase/dehydratase family protein [Yoonia sp. F2084L]